ncbi:MAG: IS21-like element helper ATPase IstB [Firmicutes bacterium]|nr:IS21-like element helper ATPase IstB [Bacillota bacterium]
MESNLLLEGYLKRLKLPAIARSYREIARDASERNSTYIEYLLALVEQEVIHREEASLRRRIKQARFPYIKTLEDYDFSLIPSLNKNKVLLLAQGDFVDKKESVVFLGNPGTGKTHLSIALGLCALKRGKKVRFYTANGLANELLEAQQEYRLVRLEKQWLAQDLVILDEIGYVPFTKTGAELLYQFCASRYERGSMIVTTNLEFSQWAEVFGDERMTAALLDRLTHRAHILLLNGESYRFRESMRKQEIEREMLRTPA